MIYRLKYNIEDKMHRLKWAYQRAFRGFDERVTWGLDSHLESITNEIMKIAEELLEHTVNTKEVEDMLKEVIRLGGVCYSEGFVDRASYRDEYYEMWKLVGANLAYFWI